MEAILPLLLDNTFGLDFGKDLEESPDVSVHCEVKMMGLVYLVLCVTVVAVSGSFNQTEVRGFRAGFLDLEKEGVNMPPRLSGGGGLGVNPVRLTGGSNLGIDVSQPLSSSDASCMVDNGYGAVIIPRAFYSSGSPDKNACGSLEAGLKAGFKNAGVYMFPCPQCGSASAQFNSLTDYLNGCSAFKGKVWLDVEGSQYWLGDTTKNRNWYQDLVDSCTKSHFSCGVYSSLSQWEALFGSSDYQYGSNLPLWYAHYDGKPSFDDFESGGLSFGGFKAYAKQYLGDQTLCSFGVDENYYPH